MKTLHLVLKSQWYNRWLKDKTEDYREINEYWLKRLFCKANGASISKAEAYRLCHNLNVLHYSINEGVIVPKKFDVITLHLGYSKTTYTVPYKETVVATGKPEWGAEPNKQYFIIRTLQFV